MLSYNSFPLGLGLILFSFSITSILIVPFTSILYRDKMPRQVEGGKRGKKLLFDKLHDKKAGTPVGGGILIIIVVLSLYSFLFPFASRMGVYIRSSFNFTTELFIIYFTFITFGILGFFDDLLKILGKPVVRRLGVRRGLNRASKFILQWSLGLIIGFILYRELGIRIVYVPLFDIVLNLGYWYVPFAAFVVVSFSNAFNITDGLDGLASGLLFICLTAFGKCVGK